MPGEMETEVAVVIVVVIGDWSLVIGCMNIFKRMSQTLTELGPTLRVTLFRDEAAQASH